MTAFMIANPVGALTAAALTAGEAFLRLIGVTRHAMRLRALGMDRGNGAAWQPA